MNEIKKESGFKKIMKTVGKVLLEGLKIFVSMFKKDFKKDSRTSMLEWKKDVSHRRRQILAYQRARKRNSHAYRLQ